MTQATVQFMIGVGTMLAIAIITLAQQRKISREQYDASKREWQDVATLQKEHIKGLEMRVEDLQRQIDEHTVGMRRVTSQRDNARDRADRYWVCIEQYRERLERLGQDPGPEPNGEGH